MKSLNRNVLFIIAFIIMICLSVFIFKACNFEADMKLKQYCDLDGGEHIYQVAYGVKGYYYASRAFGCGPDLEAQLYRRQYNFIEMTVTKPDIGFITDQPGLYRFYLAPRNSPKCKLFYEKYGKLKMPQYSIEGLDKLTSPYCVASEKVKTIKSDYAYYGYVKWMDIEPSINRADSRIVHIKSGTVLAHAVVYASLGNEFQTRYYGLPLKFCPAGTKMLEEILQKTLRSENSR